MARAMIGARRNFVIFHAMLTLLIAPDVGAQSVSGHIVDGAALRDLGGALISATSDGGPVVTRRAIASGSGRFLLELPTAGTWRVTVAAIGYQPQTVTVAVSFRDRPTAMAVVRMVPRAYQLPEIVAAARGSTCRPDPAGAPILDQLIREAETALQLVQVSIDSRRLEFVTEVWARRHLVGSTDTARASVRSKGRASWPLSSADPAVLQQHGFVVDEPSMTGADGYADDAGPVYYGPDASVLFSDWFLESHCFELAEAQDADSLRIRFTPRGSPSRPDVAGELVIDRQTSTLTRFAFQYVGLPRWVPAGDAGGEIAFRRLDDGLWIVSRWQLRAPIRHENGIPRPARVPRYELGGWAETGGSVTEVVGH